MSFAHVLLRGITPRLRGTIVAESLKVVPETEPHGALSGARQCHAIHKRLRSIVDDPRITAVTREIIESWTTE
jgi:hypothetical protein